MNKLSKEMVKVGNDLLTSISSGMYISPLEVYREFIQNSIDAYEKASTPARKRKIDIQIDRVNRTIRILDFASGIKEEDMLSDLLSIGNSKKRASKLRGFRGIGRFSSLGYCKKIIFRSRFSPQNQISELVWDSSLLSKLQVEQPELSLQEILVKISTFSVLTDTTYRSYPDKFFECIFEGIRYYDNDILLNSELVKDYLSETAPVPFHKDFSFSQDISEIMGEELLSEVYIHINGNLEPIYRPHRNFIHLPNHNGNMKIFSQMKNIIEIEELQDLYTPKGDLIAKGWIMHHEYPGSLSRSTQIRGLRVRIGNMQIGGERIFDSLFSERRFNTWCIGEIHICTCDIIPSTRRDSLQLSPPVYDLKNAIKVVARNITDICRESSRFRNKKLAKKPKNILLESKKYEKILTDIGIQKPFPNRIVLEKNTNAKIGVYMLSPQLEELSIYEIELDKTNPRIQRALKMYGKDITAERIALALKEGTDDRETSGTTFTRLRNSIIKYKGITNPIIVNSCDEGYTCIEGNTRLLIYREEDRLSAKDDMTWRKIPSLVFVDANQEMIDATRLQAHLVGPRPWDPYSKAKYIHNLWHKQELSQEEIVEYCGGNKGDIETMIFSYELVEDVYRPMVDESDFDHTRFSGFVEYVKKPGIRKAMANIGYGVEDFAIWLHDKKISRLEDVRDLPDILRNPEARAVFEKTNSYNAKKILNKPSIDEILVKLDLRELLEMIQTKVGKMTLNEMLELKKNSDFMITLKNTIDTLKDHF